MNKTNQEDDDVLFNINQVAKVLDVVPATIRNWEKAGLFTAKRKDNNYRVYNLDDIEILKKIRTLSIDKQMGSVAIKSIITTDLHRPPYLSGQGNNETQSKYSKKLLSDKWRESREKMGLTLEEVSAQVGISTSYLSKIENGLANISIELLNKLAIFYGESILYFFELEGEERVVKKGSGEIADIGLPGVLMESLISQKHHVLFPMLFTIEPGGGDPHTHHHHGEEFIYVLSGKLKVTLNYEEEYILKQGDSLFFKSFDYHSWVNIGTKETKLIWVHSPIEAQDSHL